MTAYLSPPGEKPPKYPWDQWLDGQQWTILRGRDYWGETEEMVKRIRRAAYRKGLRVEIVRYPGTLQGLELKAVPK